MEAEVLSAGSEQAPAPSEAPSLTSITPTKAAETTSSRPVPGATTAPVGKQAASTVTSGPAAAPAPAGPVAVDTGLWVSNGNGPLESISREPGWVPLAWSPDNRSVAIARLGELVILDPATRARRPTLLEPNTVVERVAWSPDGRSLAVLLTRLPGASDLVVVDVATGGQVRQGQIVGGTSIDFTPAGCLAFGGSLDTRSDIENSGIVVAETCATPGRGRSCGVRR